MRFLKKYILNYDFLDFLIKSTKYPHKRKRVLEQLGNESDNDFTAALKSCDYIYATVYLPAKLRQLTDSYPSNNMMIKINGRAVAEASYTAIWVTTPMQEKNYFPSNHKSIISKVYKI